MATVASFLIPLLGSLLPRVEDPLPEKIGLGTPFVGAGFGGVIGGVIFALTPPARRERAMTVGGLIGFALGLFFYLLALVVQLCSGR